MSGKADDDVSSVEPTEAVRHRDPAVRAVAWLEAAKGVLALLAASGFFSLMHRDVYALGLKLVEHAHLNPASEYPHIFLEFAAQTSDARLLLLALGALAYATVRFVEAYGLFFERAWAEVLAAVSGAIYIPFEVMNLLEKPGWHVVVLLSLNVLIVVLMVRALLQRRTRVVQGDVRPPGQPESP